MTPTLCGCRVGKFLDVHRRHTIIYCPTHAAAFEMKELLKAKGEVIEAFERKRVSRILSTENDPERKRKLELRLTGLVRAVGEAEPGEREFCLAAIDEWLDYQMELQAQNADLLAALEETLCDECRRREVPVSTHRSCRIARAAIAKAKGDQ